MFSIFILCFHFLLSSSLILFFSLHCQYYTVFTYSMLRESWSMRFVLVVDCSVVSFFTNTDEGGWSPLLNRMIPVGMCWETKNHWNVKSCEEKIILIIMYLLPFYWIEVWFNYTDCASTNCITVWGKCMSTDCKIDYFMFLTFFQPF